jgi:hypothetical protein
VHPKIPYTSHNSSKGIGFETSASLAKVQTAAKHYLVENLQDGADPGICICPEDKMTEDILAYGQAAMQKVLTKASARKLAKQTGIYLAECGGTGDGIIGALAAVGLRASGNDGRFVQLPGIKELTGRVTVRKIMQESAIVAVTDESGAPVADTAVVDSKDWIRPSVVDGKPVLRVRRSAPIADAWEPVLRKLRHEEGE